MITLYLTLSVLAFLLLISQIELSWLVIFFIIGFATSLLLANISSAVLLALVLLFAALLLGRLIYLGSAEFSGITKKLGRQKTSRLLLKTTWRWLPLFLFALCIVGIIIWRDTTVQQFIYDIEDKNAAEAYVCLDQEGRTTTHFVCKETDSFENDLHAFVQRFGDAFSSARQDDVYTAIAHISKTSKNINKDLPNVIFEGSEGLNNGKPLFAKQLPKELQPPDCPKILGYLFDPKNCFKRDLLTPLNTGYDNNRRAMRLALIKRLQEVDGGVNQSSDEVTIAALQAINDINKTYQKISHKTLDLLFLKSQITTLFFYTFLLFLLLRIFLYVFTRFAFDANYGAVSLSLHKPSENRPQDVNTTNMMQVEELGNEASLDLADDTWYATKHRKVRYAQKGKPGFPMPLCLLFRRLTTGSYYLYRFGKKEGCPRLEPYADDVTHFIKITLTEADQLCISLKNLVAFSKSTQLKSLFSPKFSVFFKHSLFFTVAKGPGLLLLRVDGGKGKVINGQDAISQDEGSSFFNPVDLIAFDINGSYNLAAQHDLISVYTEGHTIKPLGNSLTIRQVHDEKGVRSILSSMRKLLLFLLPI